VFFLVFLGGVGGGGGVVGLTNFFVFVLFFFYYILGGLVFFFFFVFSLWVVCLGSFVSNPGLWVLRADETLSVVFFLIA
ncbi:hypothetical protein AB7669_31470, partial [Pseudomonas aeruginosa]|uniref:hypothetical protein n=1 Tax=Pseudomonas aeruginosa TaxID=287 RepID=UPI0034E40610